MLCNSILKNIINTYVKHLYCIFIKLMEYSTLCYIVLPNYIPLFGVSLLISFLYTYCTSDGSGNTRVFYCYYRGIALVFITNNQLEKDFSSFLPIFKVLPCPLLWKVIKYYKENSHLTCLKTHFRVHIQSDPLLLF